MFGATLAAKVPHCWQLSSVLHSLDLSSCAFHTRVPGTRLRPKPAKPVAQRSGKQAAQSASASSFLSLALNCSLNTSRSSRPFGLGKRSFTLCLWKGHAHKGITFQWD